MADETYKVSGLSEEFQEALEKTRNAARSIVSILDKVRRSGEITAEQLGELKERGLAASEIDDMYLPEEDNEEEDNE